MAYFRKLLAQQMRLAIPAGIEYRHLPEQDSDRAYLGPIHSVLMQDPDVHLLLPQHRLAQAFGPIS